MVTEATKNRVDALGIVAMAASSLFIAVCGYIISQHGERLDRKDERLKTLEVGFARLQEHAGDHDRTAAHWISQIIDSQKRCRDTERRLDRIETKSSARPDAFTGTEGARLETMIKKNTEMLRKQQNEEQ